MKGGNTTKEFRIISVRYIQESRKDYTYYDGIIPRGTPYYRGFGTRCGIPFEFFFTEELLYQRKKIKIKILQSEFEDYWTRRYVKELQEV